MKRIAFCLLLFLALPLHAQEYDYCAGAGGAAAVTVYCTGAATCTAVNPGNCDVGCEDYEGSLTCDADDNPDIGDFCRSDQGAATIASGDSILPNSSHLGTLACNDKGSYALKITSTGVNHSTFFRHSAFTNTTKLFGQFYFYISSLSLTNGNSSTIGWLGTNDGTGTVAEFNIYNNAGTYNFRVESAGMTTITSSTNIALQQWYRVRFAADETTDSFTIYIDDDSDAAANFTTANQMGRFYFGTSSSHYDDASGSVIQYDNISLDGDTLPNACN